MLNMAAQLAILARSVLEIRKELDTLIRALNEEEEEAPEQVAKMRHLRLVK